MTVEQAILNGYTTGDNLSGLIYVNTGEKTKTITVKDEVTGASQTLQVFDTDSFSQRDAGTGGNETIPGFSWHCGFFQCDTFCNSQ
mgnify:CR=1 FL=1